MMKIYISGQITGIEKEAFKLFEKAENKLIRLRDTVINPMKLNHNKNATWREYMTKDIDALMECEGIYMLKNWQKSKGAKIERLIAISFDMEIFYETELQDANKQEFIKNLDINLLLAMVKCISEQLHTMQWTHTQRIKQKFNKFFKVAKNYEKEIDNSIHSTKDETIENIYDAIMDSICEAKQISIENYEKNNISN